MGEVKEAVSSRLLDIVIQQQGLSRHLDAIKRFLLLGQGDFVRVLLDAAAPELDKSAKDVSQYTLQVGGMGSRIQFKVLARSSLANPNSALDGRRATWTRRCGRRPPQTRVPTSCGASTCTCPRARRWRATSAGTSSRCSTTSRDHCARC